jgi:hypothetical protein
MIRKTALAPCGHRHRVVPAGRFTPATLRQRLTGRRALWAFGCERERVPLNAAARAVDAAWETSGDYLPLTDWEREVVAPDGGAFQVMTRAPHGLPEFRKVSLAALREALTTWEFEPGEEFEVKRLA